MMRRNIKRKNILKITIAILVFINLNISFLFFQAYSTTERHYKIEAAFVYNFFNYITWPGYKNPESLMNPTICILNLDPIKPYLKYIQSKRANEKQIAIKELDNVENMDGCNMLLVRETSTLPAQLLSKAVNNNVLLVFSTRNFNNNGMVELAENGEHIEIAVNNSLLKEASF